MAAGEGSGRAPSPPIAVAELRRRWEAGERAACLRAALPELDRLSGNGGELNWLEGVLRQSGLIAEAFALRLRLVRQSGGEASRWIPLVRSVLQSGDPWWAAELLDEAGGGSRELQALAIDVQLALGDARAAIADWERTYHDEAAREAAVQWWVRAGGIAEAERLAEATPSLALWRARFAVWRNQPEQAEPLLAALPPSPAVHCLQAIAALQRGHVREAEAMLRPLLDGDARAEAWAWLATALRKQGRHPEAGRAAATATSLSDRFNLVLWMERILAAENDRAPVRRSGAAAWLRPVLQLFGLTQRRQLAALEHAALLYPLGARPDAPTSDLATLIERFGGNHSSSPTLTDGHTLTAYPVAPDAGQVGVSVQLVLRTRGIDATRALYRSLAPRVSGPRFRLYEGETELWMGEYARAAQIFREVLAQQRDMKWAWIGLGASIMLQGDLAAAQRIWTEGLSVTGTAGPTLLVYRGECYRRQGDQRAAREQLERAVSERPERLSAWINLALLTRDAGLLARVERECGEQMPFLMGELQGDRATRLEHVLAAMRGNRGSSRVTYHLWGRLWQFMTRRLDPR